MLIEFTTTHIIFIIKLYYYIVLYYFNNTIYTTSTLMCARARYSPLSAWKFGTRWWGKQQRYRSLTNTFILKVTSTRTQLVSHRRARARYPPLSVRRGISIYYFNDNVTAVLKRIHLI